MKKALICFLCLAGTGLFGQGIPYGQEFRVNTYTVNDQWIPRVAALTSGGFLICWQSNGQDRSSIKIHGQMFNESGERKNGEFLVNTDLNDNQFKPCIAALSGGGFVVCWQSEGQDESSIRVYGQMFNESGEKKNGEFLVNTDLNDYQSDPCIAALSGGGFVVCWAGYSQTYTAKKIYGQMFDGSGNKKNGEIQMNTYIDNSYGSLCVTAISGGGFIVCWKSIEKNNSSGSEIYMQEFNESGEKEDGEFRGNTYTNDNQGQPYAAALDQGGFVVCWESVGQDGSGAGVYGQVFDGSGEKKNDEFRVNTYRSDWQNAPTITSFVGGGFVVCWDSYGQDRGDFGVYGQMFDGFGEKKDGEFRVNTYTNNWQELSSIATLSGGGYIVCWQSYGQDGSGGGIYAKLFPSSPLLHILKPFVLIEPTNDSTLNTTGTHLLWRQPSDQLVCYSWELHYRIFIDDNPDFLSPEIKELDQDTTVTLNSLRPGTNYFWKVLAKNISGDSLWSSNTNGFFVSHNATGIAEEKNLYHPSRFVLHQNYPNPFNPETTIRFDLPESGFIVISIYDISGKLVRILTHESRTAGSYSVNWDGRNSGDNPMPSGIYICRMEVRSTNGERFVQSMKMGLVR